MDDGAIRFATDETLCTAQCYGAMTDNTTHSTSTGKSGTTGWIAAGIATAALAGAAIYNQVQRRAAETETPPAGKFVEIDGIRLHYVERGLHERDVHPVVLLHGNGMTWADWDASGVLDKLVAETRVIAFDRPGFGYSDRPRTRIWTPQAQAALMVRALAEIGVERPVVVGHSWGTLVALAMALDFPRVVSGLVLLSGYYFPTARLDVYPTAIPAIPVLGDALAYTVSPLVGRMIAPAGLKASFAPAEISPKFRRFPMEMALRPSQVRATAGDTALMVPGAYSLAKRYDELDLPVLIMAGSGDLIAHPDEHAEKLVSRIKDAELRMIEGSGHMIHYTATDDVADGIIETARRAK